MNPIKFCRELLYQPWRVFVFALTGGFFILLLDGTFWSLWNLHAEQTRLSRAISELGVSQKEISEQIRRASQPEFIEHMARDRFHLVEEGDLVFIFPDQTE